MDVGYVEGSENVLGYHITASRCAAYKYHTYRERGNAHLRTRVQGKNKREMIKNKNGIHKNGL